MKRFVVVLREDGSVRSMSSHPETVGLDFQGFVSDTFVASLIAASVESAVSIALAIKKSYGS